MELGRHRGVEVRASVPRAGCGRAETMGRGRRRIQRCERLVEVVGHLSTRVSVICSKLGMSTTSRSPDLVSSDHGIQPSLVGLGSTLAGLSPPNDSRSMSASSETSSREPLRSVRTGVSNNIRAEGTVYGTRLGFHASRAQGAHREFPKKAEH